MGGPAGESVAEKMGRGATLESKAPRTAPATMPVPPPSFPTGMPDLSEDDIASFLEQARELTKSAQEATAAVSAGAASTPVPARQVPADPVSQARFAELHASAQAKTYAQASVAAAQHMQAQAHAQALALARAEAHAQSRQQAVAKAKAKGRSRTGARDGDGPEWKYKDIKSPPDWLVYDHTKGGLPTTKPPAVPRMVPPPPPQAFPQFSYARPQGGPYSPPPVPTYSISSPPPVAASAWLPLSAYIQPPEGQPNPEA